MELIHINPLKNIVIFKIKTTIYKAKIIGYDAKTDIFNLYLFHNNQIIAVKQTELAAPEISTPYTSVAPKSLIISPLCGRVIKIYVKQNQNVPLGTPLISIESMKMENEILAPFDLFVKNIPIEPGHLVKQGEELIFVEPIKKE